MRYTQAEHYRSTTEHAGLEAFDMFDAVSARQNDWLEGAAPAELSEFDELLGGTSFSDELPIEAEYDPFAALVPGEPDIAGFDALASGPQDTGPEYDDPFDSADGVNLEAGLDPTAVARSNAVLADMVAPSIDTITKGLYPGAAEGSYFGTDVQTILRRLVRTS